jgi:hypothetical protein
LSAVVTFRDRVETFVIPAEGFEYGSVHSVSPSVAAAASRATTFPAAAAAAARFAMLEKIAQQQPPPVRSRHTNARSRHTNE